VRCEIRGFAVEGNVHHLHEKHVDFLRQANVCNECKDAMCMAEIEAAMLKSGLAVSGTRIELTPVPC